MGEKLYDSDQVRAILKLASENTSTNTPENPIGLTIDELRKLAGEAGIDPKEITRAAAQLDSGLNTKKRNFWGGPFSFSEQVLVDHEISTVHLEEMLSEIREFFQAQGNITSRGSVVEWSSPFDSTNSAHVTTIKTNGKTKINVSWKGPLTALPYYIPVPLVAIGSLFLAPGFLDLSAIPGLTFVALTTALTFLAGRWGVRKSIDQGFKKLRGFVESLENIASRPLSPAEAQSESIRMDGIPSSNRIENILKDIEIDEKVGQQDADINKRNRSRS